MQYICATLVLTALGIGVGYLFYWAFGVYYDIIPVPIKIAVIAIGLGLVALLINIGHQRYIASKKGYYKKSNNYWSNSD